MGDYTQGQVVTALGREIRRREGEIATLKSRGGDASRYELDLSIFRDLLAMQMAAMKAGGKAHAIGQATAAKVGGRASDAAGSRNRAKLDGMSEGRRLTLRSIIRVGSRP